MLAGVNSAQGQVSPATPPVVNGYAESLNSKEKRSIANQRAAHTPLPVYAPLQKHGDEGQVPEIEMFIGESRVFPAPGVGRIAVGNGALLTAAALDGKEVILFANGAGTSSLFIWNEDGRYQRVKINIVPGDTSRYAREIATFLSTIPKARASIIGDKVIVEGDELSDSDLSRIDLLAKRYPQIVNFTNQFGLEQMVMIDVKVVEFPVSELRELGLKWNAVGGAALGGIWAPGRRGNDGPYQLNVPGGPVVSADPNVTSVVVPGSLNALSVLNLGLNATLNLLEQNGKTTVLAEPQLSARNGSRASFLAGGEFPYTVSTINGPTVQFKPYGVKLDILPRVDRSGNIRATIDTEFSQIDGAVSTPAGPALLSRRTNTEFNVKSGQTIVLSGLLQRESATSVDKIPGLGDLPIIGALFRSTRFQNKETELVVFVTPTVIDSQTQGLVDRLKKTNERLQARLGPAPHLSNPLQPGRDPAQPARGEPVAHKAPATALSTNAEQAIALEQPIVADATVAASAARRTLPDAPLTPVPFASPLGSTLRVLQEGLVLHTAPDASSPALLRLGEGSLVTLGDLSPMPSNASPWLPVTVGSTAGWVLEHGVEPARLEHHRMNASPGRDPDVSLVQAITPTSASHRLTLQAAALRRSYSVLLSRLAVRLTPDINAPIVALVREGFVVSGLDMAPRGAWTAIDAGGTRGWVASEWLQPVAPITPTTPESATRTTGDRAHASD